MRGGLTSRIRERCHYASLKNSEDNEAKYCNGHFMPLVRMQVFHTLNADRAKVYCTVQYIKEGVLNLLIKARMCFDLAKPLITHTCDSLHPW